MSAWVQEGERPLCILVPDTESRGANESTGDGMGTSEGDQYFLS